jgi:pSer/pThr/pTyr-binding forkhead associated (FHA) protein
MDCPKCGAWNETQVGSCLSCGAAFASVGASAPALKPVSAPPAAGASKPCPKCTAVNAPTFKFCARCGAPLLSPTAQARPAVASKPTALAEKPEAAARPTHVPALSKAAPAGPRARISAIARDGSRSADYVLTRPETRVGSAVGDGEVKLDKDPYVASTHAVLRFEGEQLTVRDAGSENGVFLWLRERELDPGTELRIGRQRLRVEWLPEETEAPADQPLWGSPDPGYVARAVQLLEGGGEGDVFPLKRGENLVGRGSGEVSFPQDGYVSSRHCLLTVADGRIAVKDLGSANGTFAKISGTVPLATGDLLLVGEQILRVDPA